MIYIRDWHEVLIWRQSTAKARAYLFSLICLLQSSNQSQRARSLQIGPCWWNADVIFTKWHRGNSILHNSHCRTSSFWIELCDSLVLKKMLGVGVGCHAVFLNKYVPWYLMCMPGLQGVLYDLDVVIGYVQNMHRIYNAIYSIWWLQADILDFKQGLWIWILHGTKTLSSWWLCVQRWVIGQDKQLGLITHSHLIKSAGNFI